ncbi:hypothetical protein ACFL3V_03035 [Nanoarchaeota archaeon]
MKKKRTWLWLFLLVLLLAVVAYTSTQRGVDNITGHAVQGTGQETGTQDVQVQTSSDQGNSSSDGTGADSTGTGDDGTGDDGTGDDGTGDDDTGDDEEPDYPQLSACNEYNCESPGVCVDDICEVPECTTDDDCEDGDGCTVQKCFFAPHPKAFCSTDVITEYKHKDGCCPKGAYVDDDDDCVPVCGDRKCEFGENTASCDVDCRHAGSGASSAPPSDDDDDDDEKERPNYS